MAGLLAQANSTSECAPEVGISSVHGIAGDNHACLANHGPDNVLVAPLGELALSVHVRNGCGGVLVKLGQRVCCSTGDNEGCDLIVVAAPLSLGLCPLLLSEAVGLGGQPIVFASTSQVLGVIAAGCGPVGAELVQRIQVEQARLVRQWQNGIVCVTQEVAPSFIFFRHAWKLSGQSHAMERRYRRSRAQGRGHDQGGYGFQDRRRGDLGGGERRRLGCVGTSGHLVHERRQERRRGESTVSLDIGGIDAEYLLELVRYRQGNAIAALVEGQSGRGRQGWFAASVREITH